jgi:hypothetical protein
MTERWKKFSLGVIGGLAGLAAMEVAQWLTRPFVKKPKPRGTNVFASERTISPLGTHHEPDEDATNALARIGYEKIAGQPPSPAVKRALALAIHIGYGLAWAGVVGLALVRPRHTVGAGALFGATLWLGGDEIAAPLLGLSDKPTAYHPTQHLQSLIAHLGYGIATVSSTKLLEEKWS